MTENWRIVKQRIADGLITIGAFTFMTREDARRHGEQVMLVAPHIKVIDVVDIGSKSREEFLKTYRRKPLRRL